MSQKFLLTDINLNYKNKEEKMKNFFTLSNNTPRNYINNFLKNNNNNYSNNIILMNNQLKNISVNKNYEMKSTNNNNINPQNIYKNQIQNFNFIIKSFYINNYNNYDNNIKNNNYNKWHIYTQEIITRI